MGMYTVMIHPETGEEIQIKTGADDLERFTVGDCIVNLDGIYQGIGEKYRLHWIIVKGGVFVAVEPVSEKLQKLHMENRFGPDMYDMQQEELETVADKYGVPAKCPF